MPLAEIESFCAVAEKGSFTAAGKWLGVDKSKISRDIKILEEKIGATLIVRTTRSMRLTVEGQALFERLRPALGNIDDALARTSEQQNDARGEVVLTTTPELARFVLAPLLVAFRARHPGILIKLILDTAIVKLERESADLALRVGKAGTTSGVARKIAELRSGFYAAPSYLERRGTPKQVEELAQHDGLWPTPQRDQKSFAFAGKIPAPKIESGDFDVLRRVASCGGGIALLPEFLAADSVSSGALVRVLPQTMLKGGTVFLVSAAPKSLSARVAKLRQYLLEELRQHLPL